MFTMCPETLPLPDLAMHSTRTRRDRTGTAIAINILPRTVTATVATVPVHLPIPPQYARIYSSKSRVSLTDFQTEGARNALTWQLVEPARYDHPAILDIHPSIQRQSRDHLYYSPPGSQDPPAPPTDRMGPDRQTDRQTDGRSSGQSLIINPPHPHRLMATH